jgi:hypothetical protein
MTFERGARQRAIEARTRYYAALKERLDRHLEDIHAPQTMADWMAEEDEVDRLRSEYYAAARAQYGPDGRVLPDE